MPIIAVRKAFITNMPMHIALAVIKSVRKALKELDIFGILWDYNSSFHCLTAGRLWEISPCVWKTQLAPYSEILNINVTILLPLLTNIQLWDFLKKSAEK